MSKILLYILAILFLALFAFSLRKILKKKTKPFFIILLIFFIILAVIFELNNAKKSDLRQELILAFNQGREISCKKISVSKEHFNYEFGTMSFISKDNNKSLNSLILDIKDCELKDE